MGEVRQLVDHLKLEYKGLFEAKNFFKLVDSWLSERQMEKKNTKDVEIMTPEGKFIEWEISPWTKCTDYMRLYMKIRVLMYEVKKVEAIRDKKKIVLDHGHVIIILDGYLEHDYEHRWDGTPMLHFIRTMMDKFVYRTYTQKYEQRWTHDCHQIYDLMQRFFNTYREYRLVSEISHFSY